MKKYVKVNRTKSASPYLFPRRGAETAAGWRCIGRNRVQYGNGARDKQTAKRQTKTAQPKYSSQRLLTIKQENTRRGPRNVTKPARLADLSETAVVGRESRGVRRGASEPTADCAPRRAAQVVVGRGL